MQKFLPLFLLISNIAFAGQHNAPAGIMGDHTHKKGEFMMMYNAVHSQMKELYNASVDDTLMEYDRAPQKMPMQMYMLGGMYGITDQFNIMVMGHYMKMDMEMVMGHGSHQHTHNHSSAGIGDSEITAMYQVFKNKNQNAQINIGLVVPTGSINKRYSNHNTDAKADYMMQTGSGSYSLRPQVSWSLLEGGYEFGTQATGTFRLNTNKNGYKFGNTYNATTWVAKVVGGGFSSSLRLEYSKTTNIKGADSDLTPMQSTTANPQLYYREAINTYIGINYKNNFIPMGKILLEVGVPAYQKIGNGMLKNKYSVNLGFQHGF
jgi:hypothetical protein